MPLPSWPHLLLFMALLLVLGVYVVTVAGHFPAQARHEKFGSMAGATVLWSSILVAAISIMLALYFAAATLPWYAAVIGGGLMVLAAPLIVQRFPARVVDSRIALLILATVSLALDVAACRFL